VERKRGRILSAVRLYCIKQGDAEEKGPFTFSQVQNMWRAGSVKVTDKIRRADKNEWHSVEIVRRDLERGGQLTVLKIFWAIVLAFLFLGLFWWCSVYVLH
jgi:uncharacterized protein DUF4339